MAKEMMEKIRQAETQAAKTRDEARKRAADIEKRAAQLAEEMIRQAKNQASQAVQTARDEAEAQGENEARECALEGAKDVEALKALAAQKEKEAVRLVTGQVTGISG